MSDIAAVPPVSRSHTKWFAFGALAVAAVASVVVGTGRLLADNGDADAQSAGGAADKAASEAAGTLFGSPHYLACARVVAEGTVTAADPLDDPELLRVTVHVTRYYTGGEARPAELTYVISEVETGDIAGGDRVLFGVPKNAVTPDYWAVGEKEVAVERALIRTSLSESRGITCS